MAAVLRRVWAFVTDYDDGGEDSMDNKSAAAESALSAAQATEWSLSFVRPLIPDTVNVEAQDQEQCNEVRWHDLLLLSLLDSTGSDRDRVEGRCGGVFASFDGQRWIQTPAATAIADRGACAGDEN